MNNHFPPGQASQSPSRLNNRTAAYGPAQNSMAYHNNRTQVQTASYGQVGDATQDKKSELTISNLQPQPQWPGVFFPQMPPHDHIASPLAGQQLSQHGPPSGNFVVRR